MKGMIETETAGFNLTQIEEHIQKNFNVSINEIINNFSEESKNIKSSTKDHLSEEKNIFEII